MIETGALLAIRIKDGIFIGNAVASRDDDFLHLNKVTSIVNCAGSELSNIYENAGIKYLTYYGMDSLDLLEAPQRVAELQDFADECLDRGECILIHSVLGLCRSAAATIAYFMVKYGWKLTSAIDFVTIAHPDITLKPPFLVQLTHLEKALTSYGSEDIFHPDIDDAEFCLDNEQWCLRNTYLNAQRDDLLPDDDDDDDDDVYHTWNQGNPLSKFTRRRIRFSDNLVSVADERADDTPPAPPNRAPAAQSILNPKACVPLKHRLLSDDGVTCPTGPWKLVRDRKVSRNGAPPSRRSSSSSGPPAELPPPGGNVPPPMWQQYYLTKEERDEVSAETRHHDPVPRPSGPPVKRIDLARILSTSQPPSSTASPAPTSAAKPKRGPARATKLSPRPNPSARSKNALGTAAGPRKGSPVPLRQERKMSGAFDHPSSATHGPVVPPAVARIQALHGLPGQRATTPTKDRTASPRDRRGNSSPRSSESGRHAPVRDRGSLSSGGSFRGTGSSGRASPRPNVSKRPGSPTHQQPMHQSPTHIRPRPALSTEHTQPVPPSASLKEKKGPAARLVSSPRPSSPIDRLMRQTASSAMRRKASLTG